MADVSVSGVPEIEIDEESIGRWIEGRLNDARNLFIRNMSRGTGGARVYRRGRVMHVASAPGAYPLTDSGRLVGSVNTEMNGTREGSIYSDVNYARYLTEGTTHMAPRKMLGDALQEVMEASPPPPPGLKVSVR